MNPLAPLAAATGHLGVWDRELDAARKSGDPRRIAAAIFGWTQVHDALLALTGAVTGNTDVLEGLRAEMKHQNDFATSVANIATREAVGALADMISGQIYGRTGGRRQTAGNGTAVRMP